MLDIGIVLLSMCLKIRNRLGKMSKVIRVPTLSHHLPFGLKNTMTRERVEKLTQFIHLCRVL